jgi:hypothetical protein
MLSQPILSVATLLSAASFFTVDDRVHAPGENRVLLLDCYSSIALASVNKDRVSDGTP